MKLSTRTINVIRNCDAQITPESVMANLAAIAEAPNLGVVSAAELIAWLRHHGHDLVATLPLSAEREERLRAEIKERQEELSLLLERRRSFGLFFKAAQAYPEGKDPAPSRRVVNERHQEIRARYRSGESKKSLATAYSLTKVSIYKIVRGVTQDAESGSGQHLTGGYRYHGLTARVFNAVRAASKRDLSDMREPTQEEVLTACDWGAYNIGEVGRAELAKWADKRYPGILDNPRAHLLKMARDRVPTAGDITAGELKTMEMIRRALTMKAEGALKASIAKDLGVSLDRLNKMFREARHCDLDPR